MALSPLLLHCLRGGVACWLTPSVVAPLHEVVSVWQRSPVVVSRFLLGYRSQSPFTIDFDLLYDVDASHGIIRIPWNRKESQKSDSKLDSKERKSQILQGILRKLAFYQLNYSRSASTLNIAKQSLARQAKIEEPENPRFYRRKYRYSFQKTTRMESVQALLEKTPPRVAISLRHGQSRSAYLLLQVHCQR